LKSGATDNDIKMVSFNKLHDALILAFHLYCNMPPESLVLTDEKFKEFKAQQKKYKSLTDTLVYQIMYLQKEISDWFLVYMPSLFLDLSDCA
jgi:hypothetical protein